VSAPSTLHAMADAMENLQRIVTDPRSLSVQVAERIRELISGEALLPGQRLPTEADFSDRFGVGRTTVREALRQLENDGLIQVRRGLGRFVSAAPAVRRPLTRLEGVTEMMQESGYQVTNRVLSVAVEQPAEDERDVLRLPVGAEVIRLERLRLRGDEAYIYSVDVMPRSYFPGDIAAIDWRGSLMDLLEDRGARPVYAVAQISALHLPRALARRHGLDATLPWLLMVQTNTTDEGVNVIYSHDYHRGDRFSFDVPRRAEQRA
jgi:GntR family transcriptional regulator